METIRSKNSYKNVIINVIDNFNKLYDTTESLIGLLQILEDIPEQDKLEYETYITQVINIIYEYGLDDKKITKDQENSIMIVLLRSYIYTSQTVDVVQNITEQVDVVQNITEQADEFTKMIDGFIEKFHTDFTTVGCLKTILFMIDNLPKEAKYGHTDHVRKIKADIGSFGNNYSKLLTQKQKDRLLLTLGKGLRKKDLMYHQLHQLHNHIPQNLTLMMQYPRQYTVY